LGDVSLLHVRETSKNQPPPKASLMLQYYVVKHHSYASIRDKIGKSF